MNSWFAAKMIKTLGLFILCAVSACAPVEPVPGVVTVGADGGMVQIPVTLAPKLDAWKASLVKSCEAGSIVNGGLGKNVSLDAALVKAKMPGGLVSKPDGSQSAAVRSLKYGLTELNSRVSLTTENSSLVVETVLKNSECTVRVDGSEVARVPLLSSLLVVSVLGQNTNIATQTSTVAPVKIGNGEVVGFNVPDLSLAILKATAPPPESVTWVESALGIPDGTSLVSKSEQGGGASFLKIDGQPGAMWTALSFSIANKQLVLVPQAAAATLTGAFAFRALTTFSTETGAPLHAFQVAVRNDGTGKLTVTGTTKGELVETSETLAQSCANERLSKLLAAQNKEYTVNSLEDILWHCRDFSPDGAKIIRRLPEFRAAIVSQLSSRGLELASKDKRFQWDNELGALAIDLFFEGQDVQSIDSNKLSRMVERISQALAAFKAGLPSVERPLQKRFLDVAISWGKENQTWTPSDVSELNAAASKCLPLFTKPFFSTLGEAKTLPLSVGAKKQIGFCKSLTSEDERQVNTLRQIAKTLNIEDALQTRLESVYKEEEAKSVMPTIEALLNKLKAFQNTEAMKSRYVAEASEVADVLADAVQGRWQEADVDEIQAISVLAAKKLGCRSFETASALINCSERGFLSSDREAIFWKNYGGRYRGLAKVFGEVADGFSEIRRKEDTANAFFSKPVVWASCNDAAFSAKKAALPEAAKKLREAPINELFTVERQFNLALADCEP
jgi:hypothetical protein